VKVIEFGGLKVEVALAKAAEASVAAQVTPIRGNLPREPVRMDAKGAVSEIPRLIEARSEALVFKMGTRGYYGPAIESHSRELSSQPFFKYVVVNQADGQFAGLADGQEVAAIVRARRTYANDFVRWLESSDTTSLTNLPRFVSARDGVEQDTDHFTASLIREVARKVK
jgi:hypothetical protein